MNGQATIPRSITGIGPSVPSTLLAEAGDVLGRRDYKALRCLCGTAPVTRQSGRMCIVTHSRRLASRPAARAHAQRLRAR